MTQHTPGPWDFTYVPGELGHVITVAEGEIAEAFSEAVGLEQAVANARLIAAAPELETVASSFEIKGPDADGLLWLILTDPASGNRAAFNMGRNEGIASRAALGLEKVRRAAIAKATGSP